MKIADVMHRTGLTERTIRYYEEQGLVTPTLTESGGRTYREFNEDNISELETVAALRKLLFTIDEIKAMRADASAIPGILERYRTRLTEASEKMLDVLATLDRMDTRYISNVTSLARGFTFAAAGREVPSGDVSNALPAYEPQLRFGQYDEDAPSNRSERLEEFNENYDRLVSSGERMVGIIAVVEIIGSILNLVINFNGFGSIVTCVISIIIAAAIACGVGWVRYLYIVMSIISCFTSFVSITFLDAPTGALGVFLWIFAFAALGWRIFVTAAMMSHKGIQEYFSYKQH